MRSTGRTLIARVILTVLLLGALVFLVFRLITHDTGPKTQVSKANQATTSKQKISGKSKRQSQKATPSKLPGDSVSNTPATTPATGTTPAPAKTPATATAPTATQPAATPTAGKDLANSGPGDVVALFIGTAAVSALIHRRFMLSRSTASQ